MAKILKFKQNLKHHLKLAQKRKGTGDLWGVLEICSRALEISTKKSDEAKVHLLLGECFFEMKQFEQSLFHFFCSAKDVNLRASAFFGVAKNLTEKRELSLALDYFERVLDFDTFGVFSEAVLKWSAHIKNLLNSPKFEEENLRAKARGLILEKNQNGAKQILFGLESTPETLTLLSLCSILERDFFSAKKFAKMAENDVGAKLVLFECYKHENNISKEKILKDLELFETKNPKDLEKLGIFFARQKNFDLAKKFFEKWTKVDEFNPKAHLFLALVFQNLKDRQNALFCLQTARWLDFLNPIYEMFLLLFRDETQDFPISKSLPKNVEKEKIEALFEVFFCGKFEETLKKSHTLLLDCEWCFSLENFDVTNACSSALCLSKNKKAKSLIEKMLLKKLPPKQKFLITKNALLSQNFFKINLVSNNHFSSFCLAKNELNSLNKLKKGTAKAISFCECFFPQLLLMPKILKFAKQNQKNQFLIGQKSNVVACFLLKDSPKVFLGACKFFEVEPTFVDQLFASQQLVEKSP